MFANWQSFIKSEVFYHPHHHCADINILLGLLQNVCQIKRKKAENLYLGHFDLSRSGSAFAVWFSLTPFPCAVRLSQKLHMFHFVLLVETNCLINVFHIMWVLILPEDPNNELLGHREIRQKFYCNNACKTWQSILSCTALWKHIDPAENNSWRLRSLNSFSPLKDKQM